MGNERPLPGLYLGNYDRSFCIVPVTEVTKQTLLQPQKNGALWLRSTYVVTTHLVIMYKSINGLRGAVFNLILCMSYIVPWTLIGLYASSVWFVLTA